MLSVPFVTALRAELNANLSVRPWTLLENVDEKNRNQRVHPLNSTEDTLPALSFLSDR